MTSIKYDYSFLAGFYHNGELLFNSYNLILHLYVVTDSDIDQQTAFSRMDLFMHDIVENSVFVEENDINTIERLRLAEIKVLTINEPGPIDQIVQVTLVNKLNAITENKISIFESELSSCRGGYVKYMYYSNEDTLADYELISNDPRKWWTDNYPRVISVDESSDICNLKHSTSWQELELGWEDEDTILYTESKDNITNIITMKIPENDN